MEELRREALEFYNKSSNEVKALAMKFFNHMDSDGDSSINVAEFSAFIKGNKLLSKLLIPDEVFKCMDRDGNGELDFIEFITFFYVIFGSCICNGCGVKLMGQRHMTCSTCFATKRDTFDLCAACLSSKRFKHQHADFWDFKLLIFKSIPSSPSTRQPMVEEDNMDKWAPKVLEGTLQALKVTNGAWEFTNNALEVANAIGSCHIM